MNKMMAHPMLKTQRRSRFKNMAHPMLKTRLAAVVAAILVVAALLSSMGVPAASAAATPSNCTSSMKTVTNHAPGKQALTELRGPAYATIWVNTNSVPLDAAWKIPKNPSWGQTEVKVRIDWGVEVNIYNGAGGTFVQYSRNADCQAKMVKDFNADSRPSKTLDAMRQWEILSLWHVGKS